MANDLNEVFEEAMEDALVITVPIDDTLSNSGEAADAKAVGEALALKANASDIASIKVNDQQADNQGQILLSGEDVPMSDTDTRTLKVAIDAAANRKATDIPMSGSDSTTIAAKMSAVEESATRTGAEIPLTEALGAPTIAEAIEANEGAVKSVNGEEPDANGDVTLQRVSLAGNLETSFQQQSSGAFLRRTSGGSAAIVDGDAHLLSVMGNRVHTGYVAEVIAMSVQPASSSSNLAATMDKAVFRDYVEASGTITLTYSSSWSEDPADYGITVTGTAASGDQIVISYVKEERGTITNAFGNDASVRQFIATGWNLYQVSSGYARVVKYSDEYGYKISGAYSALQFAATIGGARQTITPNSAGIFSVPSDGYVFVNGGNSTSTAIYPTWADWTGGYPGSFEAYSQSVIDLTNIIDAYFQDGMFQVGDTRDEISVVNGEAINRIERMTYSAEALASVISSGRAYEYDEDFIYVVKATASTHQISLSGTFTVSDHGIEFFEGSSTPVYVEANYSMNLKNKLERDVLTISQQTLTPSEQTQVRANIGAADSDDVAEMAGLVCGFIDPSRVLKTFSTTEDWTATGNCWLVVQGVGDNGTGSVQININDVNIWSSTAYGGNWRNSCIFPVKEGQTIGYKRTSSAVGNATVYAML